MSNNKKNVNVWNLINKSSPEENVNKKRKIILNNNQKYKYVTSRSSTVIKHQEQMNINKQTKILNIQPQISLRSVQYNQNLIQGLNPTVWIDPSDLTSVLRDKNNNVYQILDKSGNNNHLYQNVVANQPKYHNGGLLFNGNQYINGNYTFNQSINTMSMFIVIKQYEQVNIGGIISGYSINSSNDYNDSNAWAFTSKDISTYQYQLITNQNTLKQTNNINKTIPYGIYEIVINNGNNSLYYNGNLVANSTFSGLGDFTNLVLGARFSGSNTFDTFNKGEIYEVIILPTAVNNSNRYKIEKYLLDKWGTTQISRTIPISNIYAWLDASSKENFTLDNNNNVLAWNDKNFKLNFTQSNPTYYPVFDTNKVIFDDSYLTMTDTVGLNLNNFSIFYVFDELSHNDNAGLLSCINTLGQTDNQNTNCFALTTPSSNTIRLSINSTNLNYTDSTSLSKKLYEFNVKNGIGTLYVNGVVIQNTTFGTLGTGLKFAIGARQNSGTIDTSVTLNANLYEILILNTYTSYAQRSQIYSYLCEKWNISSILSSPAPNPTIWLDSNSSSVTVDGSNNITAWPDLSSNNYPVTINNTKPVQSTINGLKYASFSGSDVSINMNDNGGALTGNNSTLYIVFSASSSMTNSNRRLVSFDDSNGDTGINTLNINNNTNNGTLLYTNASTTITVQNNILYVLSIVNNAGTRSIYLNNYLIKTYSGSTYNYKTFDLGSLLGGTLSWTGYINEFIFYNDVLDSDSNIGTINYLSNKWKINIASSPINEFLQRPVVTTSNTLLLNQIFTNTSNPISVSNSTTQTSDINVTIPVPITSTQDNQITLMTSDPIYLFNVDCNILYNVNSTIQTGVITLPTLTDDSNFFYFKNTGIYTFTVVGPNNLYINIAPGNFSYFTNFSGVYTVGSTFLGYTFVLDNYSSESATVYLGGFSPKLNYITKLNIYNSSTFVVSTGNIYYDQTYQADFTLGLSIGSYTLTFSDILDPAGNLITYTLTEPVVIGPPTAILDHYNNGPSTYVIILSNWSGIYSAIGVLDVWVSTSSDYSNSSYLVTTPAISNSKTTFTNTFSPGYYWLSLKNTDPALDIQIADPVIVTGNLSFSLTLTTHVSSNSIILGGWTTALTDNVGILYVNAYTTSNFLDVPITLAQISSSNIVNTSGTYRLPYTYSLDIARYYYLTVSDSLDFSGVFNVRVTNHISPLIITGTVNNTSGLLNQNNIFTITLSNNENYDLSTYLTNWDIFYATNNLGLNGTFITSAPINSSQQITFTFNPGSSNIVLYFYVGNTNMFSAPIRWEPTNIYGLQMWLDSSLNSNFTFSSGNTISVWKDSSGNNNTATAVGDVTLTSNQVTFDGSTGYFTTPYTAHPTAESVFVVYSTNNSSIDLQSLVDSSAAGGRQFGSKNNPSGPSLANNSIAWLLYGNYSITSGTTYIAECLYNTSGINILVSGNPSANNSTNPALTTGTTTIGAGYYGMISGISWFLDGTISEVLIYKKTLTSFERQVVEGYLAWKWLLNSSLPTSHPFYNAPPPTNQLTSWEPTNISGLQVWFDATSPQLNNSNPSDSSTINIWADKSGNLSNAISSVGTTIIKNNIQNGLPVIRMNGSQLLNCTLPSICSSYTIFTVQKCAGNSSNDFMRLLSGISGTQDDNVLYYGVAYNSNNLLITTDWSQLNQNTPTYDATSWSVLSSTFSGTTNQTYVNGIAKDPLTTITSVLPLSSINIGGVAPLGENWIGDIGEIIIYNSVLSSYDRQTVEGYLSWKWGLNSNLPSNHPFYYRSPSPNEFITQYNFSLVPATSYSYIGSAFTSVASSTDGQKLVACAKTGGSIWTSTNGGQTWIQRTSAGSRNWISVASSSNGTKLIAADQGGSVWTSSNSGVTWTERSAVGPSPQTWSYVAISANGTYALASAGVPGVATGFIYWSDDSGATWTQTGAPERNDWTSLTVSNDGATLYATGAGQYTGPIYKSTDSGTTWNLIPFTGVNIAFYAIASSSDGTKLVIGDNAGGTGVWTSTDTGLNWTNNTSYLQGQTIGFTGAVVSSDNGVKLAVVAGGSIWTSADSGATWTQETTPTGANLRIACDASGTTIYAVGDGNGTTGMYLWKGVYTTSWAWTQILISADLSGNTVSLFGCIACSKNGQYVYLAITNLPIWKSSNYGAAWAEISGSPTINYTGNAGVTCSDNGSIVMVFQYTVNVSSNYGVDWNANAPNLGALAGVVRSTKLVVGSDSNGIYVSTDGGDTWANQSANDSFVGRALTMSTNGLVIAGAGGGVSASTDGGTNWYTDTLGGSWDTIRVSADLTKLVVMNGVIFFSIDSGVSWKTLLTAGLTTWTSIWTSADFTKMAATTNGGYIRYSTDSGTTWADGAFSGGRFWTGITGDSTGQYLVAVENGGYIWRSNNYGASWYHYESLAPYSFSVGAPFKSISMSPDGSYIIASAANQSLWRWNNTTQTWLQATPTGNWSCVSVSVNNSSLMLAADLSGYLWFSNDFGVSWSQRTAAGSKAWSVVTVNGSAAAAAVRNGYIYTSSDSGLTWTERTGSGTRYWASLTISSDGTTLYAGENNNSQYANGSIYKSTDSGVTWATVDLIKGQGGGVVCSSNGSIMYMVGYNDIFKSADTGATWAPLSFSGPSNSLACSSDGTKIVAVAGGYINTSSNSGSTWTQRTAPGSKNYWHVACDASGATIYAVGDGDVGGMYIWKSTDSGDNWASTLISASLADIRIDNWYKLTCSKNGQYIYASIDSSYVWKSADYGATWTATSFAGGSSIVCSDNGSIIFSSISPYVSTDYGVTWNSVSVAASYGGAISSDGTIIATYPQSGMVYISTDTGATWTGYPQSAYYNIQARGVAMSANGQVVIGTYDKGAFVTADGGTTWYTTPNPGEWSCIRMSSNKTKILATNVDGYGSYIYLSVDSGVKWDPLQEAGSRQWTSIAVSNDFTKFAATAKNGGIYYSTDSGATWTLGTNTASKNWSSITGTSTNQTLYAVEDGGTIWTSNDYGETWVAIVGPGVKNWIGSAISADATTMVAGAEIPYISNDGGVNWRQLTLFSAGTVNTFSSFISADNTFIAVAVNGTSAQNIWTSSDSGYTWLQRTASGARIWTGISGSSNGSKLVAVAVNDYIYTSDDYGATWTQQFESGIWFSVASDSTGQYLAAVQYTGYIYTSSDYGVNWTQTATPDNWNNIASDSTGKYLVAVSRDGSIWTSADYGVTWVERTAAGTRAWYSVSCSTYGNNIVAGVTGGGSIWTSYNFGVTWYEQSGTTTGNWFSVSISGNGRKIMAVKNSTNQIVLGTAV